MELTKDDWQAAKMDLERQVKQATLNMEINILALEKIDAKIATFPKEEPEAKVPELPPQANIAALKEPVDFNKLVAEAKAKQAAATAAVLKPPQ